MKKLMNFMLQTMVIIFTLLIIAMLLGAVYSFYNKEIASPKEQALIKTLSPIDKNYETLEF